LEVTAILPRRQAALQHSLVVRSFGEHPALQQCKTSYEQGFPTLRSKLCFGPVGCPCRPHMFMSCGTNKNAEAVRPFWFDGTGILSPLFPYQQVT